MLDIKEKKQIMESDAFIEFQDMYDELYKFEQLIIEHDDNVPEDIVYDFIDNNWADIKEFYNLEDDYARKCYDAGSVKSPTFEYLTESEKAEVVWTYLYTLTKNAFEDLLVYISNINKGIKEIIEKSLTDIYAYGSNTDYKYDFKKLNGDAKNIFKVATISVDDIYAEGYFEENKYGHIVLEDDLEISDHVVVLAGTMFELGTAEGDINDCETEPVNYYSLIGKVKLDGKEYYIDSNKEYVLKVYYCGGQAETFNNDKIRIYN